MRVFVLLAAMALAVLPASAQSIQCEGSADNDVGEVIATYDLDRSGEVQRTMASFMPERIEGVGQESDYFARPRILLEYRLNDALEMVGPTTANVLVTRFSNPGAGRPPAMSTVEIKVTAPSSAEALKWNGAEPTVGERRLAAFVRDEKPAKLKVEVVAKDGKTLAAAEFDLSKTTEVQKLLARATAAGQKRVAAFQKLAGEGKAPASCPAG